MHKENLALNNQQGLICHNRKPTQSEAKYSLLTLLKSFIHMDLISPEDLEWETLNG